MFSDTDTDTDDTTATTANTTATRSQTDARAMNQREGGEPHVFEGDHGTTILDWREHSPQQSPQPAPPAPSGPSRRALLIAAALGGGLGALVGMGLTVLLLVILELPGVGAL